MDKNVYLHEIQAKTLDFRNFFYWKLFSEFVVDKNASILDVWAGQWRNIISLKRFWYTNLTATDLSDYFQDDFRKCWISFWKWNVNDMAPFNDNQFDVIILCHVIEHVEHIDWMFWELKRILKPGGLLFLETPDYARSLVSFWNDYTHIRPYNKVTLSRIARAYHFDIMALRNSQISDKLLAIISMLKKLFSSNRDRHEDVKPTSSINLSPLTIPNSIHMLYKYFSMLFFWWDDMLLIWKNIK